jgi:hypothetical protein
MQEKKNLKEIERLFPEEKATVTSKSLLKNLNLQMHALLLPILQAKKAINEGDKSVEMEISRLN